MNDIKLLIKKAENLDKIGNYKEADIIGEILVKLAQAPVVQYTAPNKGESWTSYVARVAPVETENTTLSPVLLTQLKSAYTQNGNVISNIGYTQPTIPTPTRTPVKFNELDYSGLEAYNPTAQQDIDYISKNIDTAQNNAGEKTGFIAKYSPSYTRNQKYVAEAEKIYNNIAANALRDGRFNNKNKTEEQNKNDFLNYVFNTIGNHQSEQFKYGYIENVLKPWLQNVSFNPTPDVAPEAKEEVKPLTAPTPPKQIITYNNKPSYLGENGIVSDNYEKNLASRIRSQGLPAVYDEIELLQHQGAKFSKDFKNFVGQPRYNLQLTDLSPEEVAQWNTVYNNINRRNPWLRKPI